MFILIVSALFLIIHQGQCAMKATATLYADNSITSYGILTFKQENAATPVRITGLLSGLNASSALGFHVHEYAVLKSAPNCMAAGGHFNPYNTTHGPRTPDIRNRHVGDLGNLTTDANGNINIDLEDSIIQLYNATQSIINRTIIVHGFRDDGGQGGFSDSTTTGNAGARILCGLIQTSNALIIKPTISRIMIILTVNALFLIIHQEQCVMKATAMVLQQRLVAI
ncbi:unnamed protein product [Rotaria sordida]|uniref:Superoxide dismutase copper/zinc binding domain-containing protein n=1 Tax=Rotaria sordida TaxID=392033 RepID=A0A815FNT9_9BILA|nr:unnamed protein product [Rotaria sordida]